MGPMDMMQPGAQPGAQPAAPQQADAGFPELDATQATQAFQDPKFLAAAAQTFLKRGLPEGVKWLERAHTAAKENVFTALQHLEAGDPDAAVKAFNSSGKFNDATGATKNDDGTWTINRASGKAVTLDPKKTRMSLLSPADYFKQQTEDAKLGEEQKRTRVLERGAATQELYRQDQAKHMQRQDDNTAERNELTANMRAAQLATQEAIQNAKGADARAKAEAASKYSATALYNDSYKAAQAAGDPDPVKTAMRAVVSNPGMPIRQDPKSGRIVVLDNFTNQPLREFADADEFEKVTGRRVPRGNAAPQTGATPVATTGGNPGMLGRVARSLTTPQPPMDRSAAQAINADPTKAQTPDVAARRLSTQQSADTDPELVGLTNKAAQLRRAGKAIEANNADAQAAALRQQRYGS
jgi:hypothetical protein